LTIIVLFLSLFSFRGRHKKNEKKIFAKVSTFMKLDMFILLIILGVGL